MVSDKELGDRVHEILQSSDLTTTTPATLRLSLEQEFGVNLSDRRVFISEQIDLFLATHMATEAAHGNDDIQEEEKEVQEVEEEDDNENKNGGPHQEKEVEGDEEEEVEEEEEKGSDDDKKGKKKRSDSEEEEPKRKGGGFSKPMALSPQLQKVVGEPVLARTEVVKRMWAYIRANNLQDSKDRRNISCDKTLHELFKVKTINMFQMNKVLSDHIWPIEGEEEEAGPVKEKKRKNKQRKEDLNEPKQEEKKRRGFSVPLTLSDDLVKFLGTDETELSRGEVTKRVWKYIKDNNLQDSSDRKRVVCDDKLKELFKVDSFAGLSVATLLTVHFIKTKE